MRFTPTSLASTYAAIDPLNANFNNISALLEKCLFTDGTSPNAMLADLDLNGHKIHNVANAVSNSDVPNLAQVQNLISGIVLPPGPQGPAGDISKATSVASLASITSPAVGMGRIISQGAQKGSIWLADLASNYTAQIAADTTNALFKVSTVDSTIVWARQYNGKINVRWFGATGDGVTNDSAAFVAAIAYLKAIAGNGNSTTAASPVLFVPYGNYLIGTTTLDITHTFTLEGEGSGVNGVASPTILTWTGLTTGLRIEAQNTSGVSTVDSVAHIRGTGFKLRGIQLNGGYSGTAGDYPGIHAKSRFSAEDFVVNNFPGKGIKIDCTSLSSDLVNNPEGNANLFSLLNGALLGCDDGLYTHGADSNAGSIVNVDASYNRNYGFNDNSFLGNTYVACHTSGNTLGGYRTTNSNARNLLLNCYAEGDQPAPNMVAPTIVIGGLYGNGVTGTCIKMFGDTAGNFSVENLVIGQTSSILDSAGRIASVKPTGGVGYGTGAGGAVTQTGGKNASVTLAKPCGAITTDSTALASGATVSFLVNCSPVASTDTINLNIAAGFAAAACYNAWVDGISPGIFRITIKNISAGSLSEALVLNFAVIKAVNA